MKELNKNWRTDKEFWDELYSLLPAKFTFCDAHAITIVRVLQEFYTTNTVELLPKYMRNKNIVGYRDTRTGAIYFNSRLDLTQAQLCGLELHEIAHQLGFKHHGSGWVCRKMQNKLWYNKTKKLKSVNYQLTFCGKAAFNITNHIYGV